MGHVLNRCAESFRIGDWQRVYFSQLARQTRDVWEAGLEDLARPVRTQGRRKVIDAVCTEVRQ